MKTMDGTIKRLLPCLQTLAFAVVLLLSPVLTPSSPAAASPEAATQQGSSAWLLNIDGAIGPATADYFSRTLEQAADEQAPLVILRMDTPGGLDSSMRTIVQAILDSKVPVACLVGPTGGRAASAGTYILYACHVAAMANATTIGAATPVAMGGAPGMPGGGEEKPAPATDEQEEGAPEDNGKGAGKADREPTPAGSASERKAINDAIAYIRSLAQLRDRDAEWAERAVRDAATLTASEALEKGIIEFMADTPEDLLRQLDGHRVAVVRDQPFALDTSGMGLVTKEPDWRYRFLATITDPNIAYVLMLVGVYGLLLEFYNPGAILPGVTGAISLVLAFYAFQVLPVNYAGLALMMLGIALMIGEALAPSFGVLGIGGIAAFVLGSVMLMDAAVPGYEIALPLILATGVFTAGLVFMVLGMALKARNQRVVISSRNWIGATAEAIEDFEREGLVRIHGELWQARSQRPVTRGEKLRVTAVDGLTLHVEQQTPEGGGGES